MRNRFGFYKNKKKCQLNNNRHFKKLPNQGSNLDFTDPESVVLPITPLGIYGCKDNKNSQFIIHNSQFF